MKASDPLPVLRILENDGIVHGVHPRLYGVVETWCGNEHASNATSWSIDAVNCLACLSHGDPRGESRG